MSQHRWDENLSLGREDWQRFLDPITSSPLEAEASTVSFYHSEPKATSARSSSSSSATSSLDINLMKNETHTLAARINAIAQARDSVSSMAKQLISGQPFYEPPAASTADSSIKIKTLLRTRDQSFDDGINSELNSIRLALSKAQLDTETSGEDALKRIRTVSAAVPVKGSLFGFGRISSSSSASERSRNTHDFSRIDESIDSNRSSAVNLPPPPPPPHPSFLPPRSTQSRTHHEKLGPHRKSADIIASDILSHRKSHLSTSSSNGGKMNLWKSDGSFPDTSEIDATTDGGGGGGDAYDFVPGPALATLLNMSFGPPENVDKAAQKQRLSAFFAAAEAAETERRAFAKSSAVVDAEAAEIRAKALQGLKSKIVRGAGSASASRIIVSPPVPLLPSQQLVRLPSDRLRGNVSPVTVTSGRNQIRGEEPSLTTSSSRSVTVSRSSPSKIPRYKALASHAMQPHLTPRDKLIQDQLLIKYSSESLSSSTDHPTNTTVASTSGRSTTTSTAFEAPLLAKTTTTTTRMMTRSRASKPSGSSASLIEAPTLPSSVAKKSTKSSTESTINGVKETKTSIKDSSKVNTSNTSPVKMNKDPKVISTTSTVSTVQSIHHDVESSASSKRYLKPTIGSANRLTTPSLSSGLHPFLAKTAKSAPVKRAAVVSPPSPPAIASSMPIRSRYAQRARDLPISKSSLHTSNNDIDEEQGKEGVPIRHVRNENAVSNTVADIAPTTTLFDLNGDTSFHLNPSVTTSLAVGGSTVSLKAKAKGIAQKKGGPLSTSKVREREQALPETRSKNNKSTHLVTVPASTTVETPVVVPSLYSYSQQQQQQQQQYPSSIEQTTDERFDDKSDGDVKSLMIHSQPEFSLRCSPLLTRSDEDSITTTDLTSDLQRQQRHEEEERTSFLNRSGKMIIVDEDLQRTLDAVESAVSDAGAAVLELSR